jgi:hypothetical protein
MTHPMLTLGFLVILAGCGLPHAEKRSPGATGTGDRALPTKSVGAVASIRSTKVVSAKQDPETLIAEDASTCRVSVKQFRDTDVGERVTCDWR